MKLFLDDTRDFPKGYDCCCRDYESATILLSSMKFDHISLDYSLGADGGGSGLDVLKFMKENNIFVPSVNIHSNHIIGKERMREYCEKNFPDSIVTMNMLPK